MGAEETFKETAVVNSCGLNSKDQTPANSKGAAAAAPQLRCTTCECSRPQPGMKTCRRCLSHRKNPAYRTARNLSRRMARAAKRAVPQEVLADRMRRHRMAAAVGRSVVEDLFWWPDKMRIEYVLNP